jgi:SAM-dependent methyltransferase
MKEIYTNESYKGKNPDWHESDSDWKYKQMLQMLQAISFKKVVDVGCGAGKLLENIQINYPDAELFGFDITANVHEFWKKRPAAIKFSNEDFFSSNTRYDLLMLIDVFEHVENYYDFLRKLLPRSENFIFHIPLDMCALSDITNNYPQKRSSVGHLHYFNKSTALAVLKDCGYNVVDYKITKGYLQSITKLNRYLLPVRIIFDFLLGKNFNSRFLGGYSMMVLANKAG